MEKKYIHGNVWNCVGLLERTPTHLSCFLGLNGVYRGISVLGQPVSGSQEDTPTAQWLRVWSAREVRPCRSQPEISHPNFAEGGLERIWSSGKFQFLGPVSVVFYTQPTDGARAPGIPLLTIPQVKRVEEKDAEEHNTICCQPLYAPLFWGGNV